MKKREREIPYNYTSADDDQIISHLFGARMLSQLDHLRTRRRTGRSARLLFRFMGDMFIIERNPFIFQELIDHPARRKRFFHSMEQDLTAIALGAREPEVNQVIDTCKDHLNQLARRLKTVSEERRMLVRKLGPIIGKDSIYVDPFNLTAHATDATDWRLYPPVAVVRPSLESQVPPLVRAIRELGLTIIPRGGGTGLTGGCVPLAKTCVMINTEKLNRIPGIRRETTLNGRPFSCLDVEAGVITDDAMAFARQEGLVFATDPTSSWASTIGGNIAENAGGKTAVLWGTALDNIWSYRMVMPDGSRMEIQRKDHPLRKILPDDTVVFEIRNLETDHVRHIVLPGDEIRKPGLGKDVTNKALGGVPGIQKEGCDGIITSATFILHPEYNTKNTFCIEFFGNDMSEAGQVIADLCQVFDNRDMTKAALMALEHFDEEYIKAIDYKTKAAGNGSLKAVLLMDMVADDPKKLDVGKKKLETILDRYANTELIPARDRREAERFWRDRKKLGAIAKRTNAFKLNEDIALPIHALAGFSAYVYQVNMEEKRFNQASLIRDLSRYLETAVPLEDPEWLVAKVSRARAMADSALSTICKASRETLEDQSLTGEFIRNLMELLRGYTLVSEKVKKIIHETQSRLIVIATHMHAGDGNVHVNIPVLSNDREMMKRAAATADAVMTKAVELGGAVSGEHGIGVTKFRHLTKDRIDALEAYRDSVDPMRIMNPKKLSDATVLETIFTPSFNLLELEASILSHGSLGVLATSIANCVRCGRCKAKCPVFYPHNNLFFHPRNKNLAVGALIEALLYDTQRTHSTRFRALSHLEQIADHCTICHKCHDNCPVNIDSGEVSILEREILAEKKYKHTSLPTRLSLEYLCQRNDLVNAGMRKLLLGMGTTIQRGAFHIVKSLPDVHGMKNTHPLNLVKTPMPHVPGTTLRDITPRCAHNQAILLEPSSNPTGTVFYFPGCGSERLFSDIGKATLYLLVKHSVRVILPPPFLCCGFPSRVNAKAEQFQMLRLRNTIIFNQIRGMVNDLRFDACIISCGTCKEALDALDAGGIFDCGVTDISRYILSINPDISLDAACLYHAPCHDSLKGEGISLLASRSPHAVTAVPHCCSEAGTLALSRPDIAGAMLERKKEAINTIRAHAGPGSPEKILTNCPSCIQGLGRQQSLGIRAVHLAVELAELTGGSLWEKELVETMKQCVILSF
ncbi:MAG: DUF3683 domain-containing protein [Pseudomonadota bacterium]